MFRHVRTLVVLALLTGSVPAADPDPRSLKDVFGKPCPHGEPVKNAFLGLYAGRTNLHFGQPMRVVLFDVAASNDGPYIHPRLDQFATLELTDAAGKPVPFRREDGELGGGNGVGRTAFTLWPTKDHAAGVYWKAGTYKLRYTYETTDDPQNPKHILAGKFRANELTFTVREPGAVLDKWDGKGKLRTLDVWTIEQSLYVAGLDDESAERLTKASGGASKATLWRVAVAEFAPVSVPQDRKLTADEVKKLTADLKDQDPAVRVRAVRSVSPTAPPEVLAAAVTLLADVYAVSLIGPYSEGGESRPVSKAAADALVRLGAVTVEPLTAFAERKGPKGSDFLEPPRWVVARLLGQIGPTDAAEKYLREAIRSGDDDRVGAAVKTATAWGKGGLEVVRAVLALPKVADETRRAAIDALGKAGDLKADGPALRKLVAASVPETRWAAISALIALRDTDSLPEFERLARDAKADEQTRLVAMRAVLSLAEVKAADRLLLDLIGRKEDVNLRYEAVCQAGRRKVAAALPLVLDALDDPEEPTRWAADRALRELADHPNGVGYDGKKPDAKLWRELCARKGKK